MNGSPNFSPTLFTNHSVASAVLLSTIGIASLVLANTAVWQTTKKADWFKGALRWTYFLSCNALVIALATWLYIAWHAANSLSFGAILTRWLVLTLVSFAVVNAIFLAVRVMKPRVAPEPSLVFSIFWGLAAGVAVLITIFYAYADEVRQAHAFLCSILGAAAGWVLGLYLTPQDSSERAQFAKVGTAIAAGASGYTLKTLQDWGGLHHQYAALALFGITGIMLSAATVYNTRAYGTQAIRISSDDSHKITDGKVALKDKEVFVVKAAVLGEDDTSVEWSILRIPPLKKDIGTLNGTTFTADLNGQPEGSKMRVKAESISNPRLVDFIDVTIGPNG